MGLSLSVLCVAWCCAVFPQSYMSFKRMTGFCKTLVPQQVWDDLQPIKNDDEAVKNYGIHYATKMSRQDDPPPPLPTLSSISPTCSPLHSLACHPSPPPLSPRRLSAFVILTRPRPTTSWLSACRALLDSGVTPGVHFYTLNLEKSVRLILEVRRTPYNLPLPTVRIS